MRAHMCMLKRGREEGDSWEAVIPYFFTQPFVSKPEFSQNLFQAYADM